MKKMMKTKTTKNKKKAKRKLANKRYYEKQRDKMRKGDEEALKRKKDYKKHKNERNKIVLQGKRKEIETLSEKRVLNNEEKNRLKKLLDERKKRSERVQLSKRKCHIGETKKNEEELEEESDGKTKNDNENEMNEELYVEKETNTNTTNKNETKQKEIIDLCSSTCSSTSNSTWNDIRQRKRIRTNRTTERKLNRRGLTDEDILMIEKEREKNEETERKELERLKELTEIYNGGDEEKINENMEYEDLLLLDRYNVEKSHEKGKRIKKKYPYDKKIPNIDKSWKCAICMFGLGVVRILVLFDCQCGTYFCQHCVDTLFRKERHPKCPVCSVPLENKEIDNEETEK